MECHCPGLTLCPDERTKGNEFKLTTRLAHRDCRRYYFSNRVIDDWNRLPGPVVSAESLSLSKSLLDDFFGDVRFDFA